MNSVLTYVSEPGHKLSPMAQEMYYGRTSLVSETVTRLTAPHCYVTLRLL